MTGGFCRSQKQINALHETDSEIVIFESGSQNYLACTIDSISEEIKKGLYRDPYLIGWMSVMVNLSDLAAVGAEPVGILISEIIPEYLSENFVMRIQLGISEAVKKTGTFVLGGDTNSGDDLIITGCAIGKCSNKYLKRTGCKSGEVLYTTAPAGRGNAFALDVLFRENIMKYKFLPEARLKEGLIIKDYATSCMDTSDGLISTLDQLIRLNNIGFELESECEKILEADSVNIASLNKIPNWLLLAGEHGDFELVFTIPNNREKEFLSVAEKNNWYPLKLGKVIETSQLKLLINGKLITVDGEKIRNLAFDTKDIFKYLKGLLEYNEKLTN